MSRVTLLALLVALTLLAAGCSRAATTGDPLADTSATADVEIAPLTNGTDSANAQVDPALMAQLRAELSRVLASRGITLDAAGNPVGKAVSALPKRVFSTPDRIDFPPSETSDLSWSYHQPGDYDLNGEVNVSDLTPVGIYFNAKSGDPNWNDARVADGDGNGEVNVSDITPIGVNFGIQTYGYVIESQDNPSADWQDFGFVPFTAGAKSAAQVNFAYTAAGGFFLLGFRVAPVGPPRDFSWTRYAFDDTSQDYQTAKLALIDGKPVMAFTAYRDPYGSRVQFALSQTAHPISPADWTIDSAVALDYMGFDPPALCIVHGEPVIAYLADNSPAADLRYLWRDMSSGNWSSYTITTFTGYMQGLDLLMRQERPVIFANDMGLLVFTSQAEQPDSQLDWTLHPANPSFSEFTNIDGMASGPWTFAAGVCGPLDDTYAFNRSTVYTPLGASDYSEFAVAAGGSSLGYPSLVLSGGLPAIACMDGQTAALYYLQAATRKDDDGLNWKGQTLAGGDGKLLVTENPCLCLIDGRPAILAGYGPMTLYWATGADPSQAADWHTQPVSSEEGLITHSMVSIDGLPVIATETYNDAESVHQIAVGVAQEE